MEPMLGTALRGEYSTKLPENVIVKRTLNITN
jgi:hypothetical protein